MSWLSRNNIRSPTPTGYIIVLCNLKLYVCEIDNISVAWTLILAFSVTVKYNEHP
jgi:hypothetical protein